MAENRLQRLERQPARTKEPRRCARQVDDRRFHADRAGAAVEHALDLAVHVLDHVFDARRARTARGIARWSRNRHVCRGDDRARDGVVWAADADGLQSARRAQRHDGLARQNHRQRTRPEVLCQRISLRRDSFAVPRQPRAVGHVDDQRIVLRAALGQKNAQHRVLVQRIRAETVDRLRRDRQQPAIPDDLRGSLDILFCGVTKIDCFHVDSFLRLWCVFVGQCEFAETL